MRVLGEAGACDLLGPVEFSGMLHRHCRRRLPGASVYGSVIILDPRYEYCAARRRGEIVRIHPRIPFVIGDIALALC